MTLYARVEEVAIRDFEFLRLISKDNLHSIVSKVEKAVLDFEGLDAKEGFIHQCLMEETSHLVSKGLLLERT